MKDEIIKDESPFEEVYDLQEDADERGVVLYPNVNTMKEMADPVTAVSARTRQTSRSRRTFERMADRALRLAD